MLISDREGRPSNRNFETVQLSLCVLIWIWSECRCVVEPWNLTDTLQIKRGCPYSSFQPTRGLGLVTNSSIPTSSRYTWTFDLHVGTWFMQLCSCLIPFFVNCVPPFALFNAKKTKQDTQQTQQDSSHCCHIWSYMWPRWSFQQWTALI